MHRAHINRNWLYYAYDELKLTIGEVAKLAGVSYVTTIAWIHRYNIPVDRSRRGPLRAKYKCGRGKSLATRFWVKVSKGESCWEWTGGRSKGYGKFSVDGKLQQAHRVSWFLHNGPIPEGMCVCHTCDNHGCVRPTHLFLGTHSDNTQDMLAKGRHRLGISRIGIL